MNARKPVYLTPEGIKRLRQELDHLVTVERKKLADRLRQAIQQGDLSENANYAAAKEDQAFLEGRIQQIETMLRNAVAIEHNGPSDEVRLGSRVTVMEEGSEGTETFQVVGPAEANPSNGRISNESPLGQALLGHGVDETVLVETPAGATAFRISSIE
jgi:transcription elongation factor GreA